jgi:hypothetical protein
MPSATMGESWQALTGSGQSSGQKRDEMACKDEDYSEFLICQMGRAGRLSVCEQRNAALVRTTLRGKEESNH